MVSVLCGAALHGAAHLYVAAHPWCRACGQMVSVLCVAAFHGAAHSHTAALHSAAHLHVAASHGAARAAKWSQLSVLPRPMVPRGRPNGLKFSVLPRPMVPRSSTCCRVPCGRASVLSAAQFTCCRVPWCRARHNASSLRLVAAGWSGLLKKGGSFHSRRQLLDSRRGGWTSSDRCGSQSFDSRRGA